MTGHGAKFGRKMEAAIAALLARPSIEDAARVAGVAEKTLRRWMREPQFISQYLLARREGASQAIARLQQGMGAAAITMLKLMTDPNVPAAVRLRAAEAVFIASDNFKAVITTPAWRSKPSWMLVATRDRTINPDLERWYAARAHSHTVEVSGASHSVYISRPKDVAALIEEAASHVDRKP